MEKRRLKKIVILPLVLIVILLIGLISLLLFDKKEVKEEINKSYISSEMVSVTLYDLEYNESIEINRGEEVDAYKFKEQKEDGIYVKVKYKDKFYLINENNLTNNKEEIIKEKELFVRTSLTVYKDSESSKILSYIKKGERVEVLGYDEKPSYYRDETGLHIQTKSVQSEFPVVFKIILD